MPFARAPIGFPQPPAGSYSNAADADRPAALEDGPDAEPRLAPIEVYLERTAVLTPWEQSRLLTATLESAVQTAPRPASANASARRTATRSAAGPSRASATRAQPRSGGTDWASIAQGIQTGLGLFQTGAQLAGGLAGTFGGDNRTARDFALWANRLGQGAGQVGGLMQGLQTRQVPPLPGTAGLSWAAPAAAFPQPAPAPLAQTGGQPMDATVLLGLLLNNPAVVQAIASAPAAMQPAAAQIPVALAQGAPVSIPLRDVMGTIAQLARGAALELAETLTEDDLGESAAILPDYLYAEDGELLVDPTDPAERAALVVHLLRLQAEGARAGTVAADLQSASRPAADPARHAADLWAREAGLDD